MEPPALPHRLPGLGERHRERLAILVRMVGPQVEGVREGRTARPRMAGMSRGSLEKASPVMGGLPRGWTIQPRAAGVNQGLPAPPGPLTAARSLWGAVRKARAPQSPVEGPLKAPAP